MFRKVLEVLLNMTNKDINRLGRSNIIHGPSQLGPLSDAIKASSATIRSRSNQAPLDSHELEQDQGTKPQANLESTPSDAETDHPKTEPF